MENAKPITVEAIHVMYNSILDQTYRPDFIYFFERDLQVYKSSLSYVPKSLSMKVQDVSNFHN